MDKGLQGFQGFDVVAELGLAVSELEGQCQAYAGGSLALI
jgi:hypothetical protein